MSSADLMFSINDAEFISQAVIVYNEKLDASWPIDDVNQALAAVYTGNPGLPWIYPVYDRVGVIGYQIMTRNERRTQDDIEELFWDTLDLNELAIVASKEFTVDTPCWGFTDELGEGMAAVGYIAPYGPPLPTGPINDGIKLLMGQTSWPSNGAIYLYPVRKGGDPLLSGLWLADTVDGLDENDFVDDAMFNEIRDQNLVANKYANPLFIRKRYDL